MISGESATVVGVLPHPEAGQVSGHADMVGEESPETPRNATQRPAEAGLPVADSLEIVRATCRLRLDIAHDKDTADKHNPQSCAGCATLRSLWDAQRAVARGANVLLREMWQRDGLTLPTKRGEKWPVGLTATEAYHVVRRASPELASGVAASVSYEVHGKWLRERFDALVRMVKSPPHYRETTPIPIRRQDFVFVGGRLSFSLRPQSLRGDSRGREYSLPVFVRDSYQRALLAKLESGEYQSAAAKLLPDRLRKSRWYLVLSYKRRVPKSTGVVVAAINRGIRNCLVAVTSTGETLRYDGADIEAYLRKTQARRQHIQRTVKFSGRTGRGRTCALRAIERLSGAAERWRTTKLQTLARQFVRWCAARGVLKIIIEDLTGVRDGLPEKLEGTERQQQSVWERVQEWPYYKLQMALVSRAEEAGLEVEKVSAVAISTTDPRDGSPAERDLSRWRLVCADGKWFDLDEAAAMNVLARASGAVPPSTPASNTAKSGNGGSRSPKRRRTARKSADKSVETLAALEGLPQ